MYTNFVTVNTGYQNRPGAPGRCPAGRSGGSAHVPPDLPFAIQMAVAATYNKQAQAHMAVYNVSMNRAESRRTMLEKSKVSIAIKPVSIVSGYYQTEEF